MEQLCFRAGPSSRSTECHPLNVILSEAGRFACESARGVEEPALSLPKGPLPCRFHLHCSRASWPRSFYSLNHRSPSPKVLLLPPFSEIKLYLCTRMPVTPTAMNPPACCVSPSASLSPTLSF